MNYTEYCKELCVKNLNGDDVNNFVWMINRNYKVNWYDKYINKYIQSFEMKTLLC